MSPSVPVDPDMLVTDDTPPEPQSPPFLDAPSGCETNLSVTDSSACTWLPHNFSNM
jgi:hypothetical protein